MGFRNRIWALAVSKETEEDFQKKFVIKYVEMLKQIPAGVPQPLRKPKWSLRCQRRSAGFDYQIFTPGKVFFNLIAMSHLPPAGNLLQQCRFPKQKQKPWQTLYYNPLYNYKHVCF